jgi:hypothetical protein
LSGEPAAPPGVGQLSESVSRSVIKNDDIKGNCQHRAPTTLADWINYWYETIGVNVIPANSRKKITWIKWGQYQDSPISNDQIDQWLASGAYNEGVAILAGRLWRGTFAGRHLIFIDMDSRLAMTELFGGLEGLQTFSKKHLVEQHLDNLDKAHAYVISPRPIPNMGPNKLGLEVKSTSAGIAYCTPGIHKDGHQYQIIGTLEPVEVTDPETLTKKLGKVYAKHGMKYKKPKARRARSINKNSNNPLTPERIEKISNLLAPKYQKGLVHNLVWALAGALRRRGVPLSDAEAIIRRVGELAGDDPKWIEHHVQEVRGTYERDPTKKIRGWPALAEVLA